jgi:hypothetical protein
MKHATKQERAGPEQPWKAIERKEEERQRKRGR